MKKTSFLMALMISFVMVFAAGCGGDDGTITICETAHSVFYAPMYIAENLGYFDDEGLDIEIELLSGSDAVMSALISGSAEIGLLGPETVVYTHAQDSNIIPKVFAQLTATDGSFLMGREEDEDFEWSDLLGSHIIGGRAAGLPAMSLEYALKLAGLNPGAELGDGVDTVLDLTIAYNLTTSSFIGGTGDYVTAFEPTASEMEMAGQGYILTSVGEMSGEIPFTVFAAMDDYMEQNPETMESFLTALQKAYIYMMTATDDELYDSLKASFSTTEKDLIVASVRNYMAIGAYSDCFELSEDSWELLLDVIDSAGELEQYIDYADAVDNTYAALV